MKLAIFWFLLIASSLVSAEIELHCKYAPNYNYGSACELEVAIAPNTENVGYKFTGIDDSLKETVNVLVFKKENVAFVPKESVEAFPYLRTIYISQSRVGIKVLTEKYLKDLLKFVRTQVTSIKFYFSGISQIDPKAISILQEMARVHFVGTLSIDCYTDEEFTNSREKALMPTVLKRCTNNYESDCTESSDDKPHCNRENENSQSETQILDQVKKENDKLRKEFQLKFESLTNEISQMKNKCEKEFNEFGTGMTFEIVKINAKIQKILEKLP